MIYGTETWIIKAAKDMKLLVTEGNYWNIAARVSRLANCRSKKIMEIENRK